MNLCAVLPEHARAATELAVMPWMLDSGHMQDHLCTSPRQQLALQLKGSTEHALPDAVTVACKVAGLQGYRPCLRRRSV